MLIISKSSSQKAVAACLTLTLCCISASAQSPDSRPEITVAMLAELSGDFAANGEDCRHGFETARAEYMPSDDSLPFSIRFVYGDSKGDPKTAVLEFRKLDERDNAIAVVATRSQVSMAINPLSRSAGLPLMANAGYSSLLSDNPYAFRVYPSVDLEGRFLASEILRRGFRRIAVVTLQDEWNESLSGIVVERFEHDGGAVVAQEKVLPGDNDTLPIISRIRSSSPDAIFVNLGISSNGIFIRKLREMNLSQQLFTNFWGAKQEAIEIAGRTAVRGTLYPESAEPKRKLLAAIENRFGTVGVAGPGFGCYSGLALILQTLGTFKTVPSRAAFYQALLQVKKISLLDGEIKVADREFKFEMALRSVE